ncbi:molybdopterin-guanine dinucleotide biosynthesis protein MobB [Candidatus Bathyarchaeota archaeon]|nr:molybdopterin-guanine dinucleotide biosynthesis protein MobB [Candidatus Bathyarchaeota archaeon]
MVSISSKEIAIIERGSTNDFSLESIVEKCRDNDIILVEGFRKILGAKPNVPKIVAVKSEEEVVEALKTFKPIIAFTGPYLAMRRELPAPYFDVLREQAKLAELVEKVIRGEKGIESSPLRAPR